MKYIVPFFYFLLLLSGCSGKKEHKHDAVDSKRHKVFYTCSMDPQVMENKPGKCPICHMDLTPIFVDQMQKNGVKLSDEQVLLANIKTQKVSYGFLENEIFATGVVKENQDNVKYINSRIEGRIDKLYIKTNGVEIKKGQVLYQIYSEMLAATQSEYIQNWKLLLEEPNDPLLKTIMQTASHKLKLWGLTESQLEQLKLQEEPVIPYPILSPFSGTIKSVRISEGSAVMEGQALFELTGYNSLWVEAQFYPGETEKITEGKTVNVYVEGIDGTAISGKIFQILPQVSASSTISIIRILITPKDENIRPGMQANIAWNKKGSKSIVIPSSAILREVNSNTVWIKNKDKVYEPVMVEVYKVSGTKAEILKGLKEGDEIVISGAYLLQSEFVFKKGHDPMAGHDM